MQGPDQGSGLGESLGDGVLTELQWIFPRSQEVASMTNPVRTPPNDCGQCFLRSLCIFGALTSDEIRELGRVRRPTQTIEAGTTLCHEGAAAHEMFTLYDGWAIKYRILETGKRQIVSVALPGDLIGEYAEHWSMWQYSVDAICRASLCTLDRALLVSFRRQHPHLADATINLARVDERIVSEHLLSVARRSARDALIHLLLEIFVRLRRRTPIPASSTYFVPLTQEHIGDMIGLSTEYVNRLLAEIRAEGLMTLQGKRLVVPDFLRAAETVGFDPSFLEARATG